MLKIIVSTLCGLTIVSGVDWLESHKKQYDVLRNSGDFVGSSTIVFIDRTLQ